MIGTTGKGKTPFADKVEAAENRVLNACEFIGYGRVMQLASDAWKEKAKIKNQDGMGLVIGPHVGMVEPCGCDPEQSCEWCCGSGWLTKHVKKLKEG